MINIEQIKKHMRDNNLNGRNVAKATGVDETTISQWLNERRGMTKMVKAMFWYYFKCLEQDRQIKTIKSGLTGIGVEI